MSPALHKTRAQRNAALARSSTSTKICSLMFAIGHLFVEKGGLISYGTDQLAMFGQTASYVDRILRGAKPAELPVQTPTKYETTLNLKTAKALGLKVPPGLIVAADQVFE